MTGPPQASHRGHLLDAHRAGTHAAQHAIRNSSKIPLQPQCAHAQSSLFTQPIILAFQAEPALFSHPSKTTPAGPCAPAPHLHTLSIPSITYPLRTVCRSPPANPCATSISGCVFRVSLRLHMHDRPRKRLPNVHASFHLGPSPPAFYLLPLQPPLTPPRPSRHVSATAAHLTSPRRSQF